jgi:hypothetical protein
MRSEFSINSLYNVSYFFKPVASAFSASELNPVSLIIPAALLINSVFSFCTAYLPAAVIILNPEAIFVNDYDS